MLALAGLPAERGSPHGISCGAHRAPRVLSTTPRAPPLQDSRGSQLPHAASCSRTDSRLLICRMGTCHGTFWEPLPLPVGQHLKALVCMSFSFAETCYLSVEGRFCAARRHIGIFFAAIPKIGNPFGTVWDIDLLGTPIQKFGNRWEPIGNRLGTFSLSQCLCCEQRCVVNSVVL